IPGAGQKRVSVSAAAGTRIRKGFKAGASLRQIAFRLLDENKIGRRRYFGRKQDRAQSARIRPYAHQSVVRATRQSGRIHGANQGNWIRTRAAAALRKRE